MAYFTQPIITNVGRSNLLAEGLRITRMAFGLGYSTTPATLTRLQQETFSVSNPVLIREEQHIVISCMVDNHVLNLTSSRIVKEIGVFARVGSGSEFLLAYSSYSMGDTVPSKTEALYQREWQLRLGVANASNSSISYHSSVSGYAGANVVNALSQRMTTHENDSTKHITTDERTKWNNCDLYVDSNMSGHVDNLGTPGIYAYTTEHGVPGAYGYIIVMSNSSARLGQNRNWTFQIAHATNGDIYYRRRINTDAWTQWQKR